MADVLAHDAKITTLLRILRAIDAGRITRTDMEIETGLSRSTLMRVLRLARKVMGVEIVFVRTPPPGHYRITDWGLLNPVAVRKLRRRRC
jgi:hypothetical protein